MAGYKIWTFGEKLNSADVNGYLMGQAVPRFATAAARDAAITAPEEGGTCYLTSVGHMVYNGTKWVPLPGTEIGHLYRSTTQSIANNTYTALSFSGSDLLKFGGWASTPYPTRFVAPFPGRYQFDYSTAWAAAPTTQAIRLEKNATAVNGSKIQNSATGISGIGGSARVVMNGTTDYVEVTVLQVSGAALNTYTADGRPELRVTFLG